MVVATEQAELIERARALRPLIESLADEMERERRMPAKLVDALHEARLFHLFVPRSIGGLEVDPITFMRVVEEVSAMDGSAGWNLMIGAGNGALAGIMHPDVVAEVFRDERTVVAAAAGPLGKAEAVDGGYQVTGRWPFASGIHHSTWVSGLCLVFDGDELRMADGLPAIRMPLVPKSECEVLDEWHVSGLCGTGSETFTITDVFVPEERALLFSFDKPHQDGPLYRMPMMFYMSLIALVPLGIARAAIDALVAMASKVPMRFGAPLPLRERAWAQSAVAKAEALLGSARSYLYEAVEEMWESAQQGDEISLEQRSKLWLAKVHAATASAEAVDLAYRTGGGTSIYEKSLLQRCFRDVHAATQHVGMAPDGLEDPGRVLFGLPPVSPLF